MERRTLLEIVNDVNASMDYEAVDSISDTPEAEQVARLVRGEYFKFASLFEWDHIKTTTKLEGLGDTDYPTTMKIPNTVAQVVGIRYLTTESGADNENISVITFYENPQDFLDKIYLRNTSDDTVDLLYDNAEGIPLFIKTDEGPNYATTFDGIHIVFDSYDSDVDTTLQQSKSVVTGYKASAWINTNSAYPDLNVELFPLFITKCKLICNEQIRQVTLRQESRDFIRMFNRLKRKTRVQVPHRKPNYGRNK